MEGYAENIVLKNSNVVFINRILKFHLKKHYFRVLAGSAATAYLTEDRSSSIRDGHPLRPTSQLWEGRTWSGEGEGLPPSQPDKPNQPW